jgi:hypothetical protein
MNLSEARILLGKSSEAMTDVQVEQMIDELEPLVDVVIDSYNDFCTSSLDLGDWFAGPGSFDEEDEYPPIPVDSEQES